MNQQQLLSWSLLIFQTEVLDTLHSSPCFLSLLSLHFDIQGLVVITTKQNLELAKKIAACNQSSHGYPGGFVQVINGSETNALKLKATLSSLNIGDLNWFVLLCSVTCQSLFLFLATKMGLASSHCVWLVFHRDAVSLMQHRPTNILAMSKLDNFSIIAAQSLSPLSINSAEVSYDEQ